MGLTEINHSNICKVCEYYFKCIGQGSFEILAVLFEAMMFENIGISLINSKSDSNFINIKINRKKCLLLDEQLLANSSTSMWMKDFCLRV